MCYVAIHIPLTLCCEIINGLKKSKASYYSDVRCKIMYCCEEGIIFCAEPVSLFFSFDFCFPCETASYLQMSNHQFCDKDELDLMNVQRWQYLNMCCPSITNYCVSK